MTEKRKFTKEEKLRLLTEASEKGVKITLEKHGIYPATYYSWKKKYESMGEAGFRHGMTIHEMSKLDISDLAAGYYLLRIENGKNTSITSLIIC